MSKCLQSGWKIDKDEMAVLRRSWHQTVTSAESILSLLLDEAYEPSNCWREIKCKLHVSARKICLVII